MASAFDCHPVHKASEQIKPVVHDSGSYEEFGYSGLAYCRVAALPHQREPVNMVQGSNYSAHWKPPKQRCLTYAHLILDTMETEIDGC